MNLILKNLLNKGKKWMRNIKNRRVKLQMTLPKPICRMKHTVC
jgi:hypothetical protein